MTRRVSLDKVLETLLYANAHRECENVESQLPSLPVSDSYMQCREINEEQVKMKSPLVRYGSEPV